MKFGLPWGKNGRYALFTYVSRLFETNALRFVKQMSYISTKIRLEKNAKETTTTKNMKASTIFGGFWGQN